MKFSDAALDRLVHSLPLTRSKTSRISVVWRYLPGQQVKVKHALDVCGGHTGHVKVARCGLYSWNSSVWMGTGSQNEYERVETLPECKSCVRTLNPEVPAVPVDSATQDPQDQKQAPER